MIAVCKNNRHNRAKFSEAGKHRGDSINRVDNDETVRARDRRAEKFGANGFIKTVPSPNTLGCIE
jgi:hypothetical protein